MLDKWSRELAETQQLCRVKSDRVQELEEQLRNAQQDVVSVEQQKVMLANQMQSMMNRGYYHQVQVPQQLQQQLRQVDGKLEMCRRAILNLPQEIKNLNDFIEQHKPIMSKLKVRGSC